MLWKALTKNPIFAVGILMLVILFFDLSRRGKLPAISRRVIPTSCRSATIMLKKRTPDTWDIQCQNNNMKITIHSQLNATKYSSFPQALYRELANNLKFISQNSLNESLERTLIVRVHVVHPQMKINAITEGKHLARLATLERPDFIAQHLKATVQVQRIQ